MKTLRSVLALLAIFALLCGATAHLRAEDGKKSPLYIALFRLSVGEDNRLQEFQAIKVIDLLSGSNNPATIELPPAFIGEARKKVEDLHLKPTLREGKPSNTLASFLYAPGEEQQKAQPGITFGALNGAMNSTSEFQLLGQGAAVSTFVANVARSAFFVSYYALAAMPKATREQREALVEAELQRSLTNVQNAEVLSRKNLSTDSQTIMDFSCKSPRNRALTIHTRYICNDRQMLAFTTITPDGLSPEDTQAFDRLFEAFRFP